MSFIFRGPLNEDVFAARSTEITNADTEIKELQGQIYKVLLQVQILSKDGNYIFSELCF